MTSAALGAAIALSFTSFGSAPKPEGFLAEPASGKGPGVLVLHAWWGAQFRYQGYLQAACQLGIRRLRSGSLPWKDGHDPR